MIRLIFALALATSLSGCFFFMIPGSAIDSVTDSVTGATGANCVGQLAKVGDRILLPNGTYGTIKSLSGTSSRCQNAALPIRALIVADL